ncbi:hypothetical protein [Agrobacterium rubi]|uniref:hypothetical protein n=1 Tax=Agrobacterium rubi TaxID=28099 RepID=UPI0015735F3D|nr:hypothetical protein [Agrobacterium rubi]NTE87259.1 hypothetical protein [Agrobacterium rubi]NTF03193.1 hypothetical protein [Agrobacterium rubi]
MSEQMTRVADVVDLLGKVDRVIYNTGWESNSLAADAIREITRLRKELSEAKKIAVNAEAYGYGHGLEAAAKVAETYEPVMRLLPLCSEAENEAAFTGQHETSERIANSIRALQSEER